MKTTLRLFLLFVAVCVGATVAMAQGTAFYYQGRLDQGGAPANGLYQMRFSVFDVNVGSTPLKDPYTDTNVWVTNGAFTAWLDFGPGVFTGPARWLQIEVRTNDASAAFATLIPRQNLLPTPYAMHAETVGPLPNGSISAPQLSIAGPAPVDGQVLGYDGSSLTWRHAPTGGDSIWSLQPSSGVAYYNAGNVGIGSSTPNHRLRIGGIGPWWTSAFWQGAIELENAAAIGWRGNSAGNKFGIGQTHGGLYIFASGSEPGNTVNPANYLMVFDDFGHVNVSYNLSYGGLLNKLDTRETAYGIVRAHDLWLGHSARRGSPGRALVDLGDALVVNFASDWQRTVIGGSFETAEAPFATIRSHDLFLGHSARRGAPGRALVDWFNELHINWASDWANTVIGGANVSVCTLTIRGGCDLAEPFPMDAGIEKGSVMVIDNEKAGRLKRSSQAYDRRVAGIVSGANGINPGIALKQEGVLDQGENVALSGRVYALADASNGEIKPGDLLTTSETPGHAMRVTDHGKAQGAILGKAMSGLKEGRGTVLVLVTLQ